MSSDPPLALALPLIPGSQACPTQAWDSYVFLNPGGPMDPAFTTPLGLPLTPTPIVSAMRAATALMGRHYSSALSMHSLRRGGALGASQAGAPRDHLATHGTWASDSGLSAYVPPPGSREVASRFTTLFGPVH